MSYEGYTQYLCKKGHYKEENCMADELNICHCGEPIVWRNMVNITNGSFEYGKRIDGYKKLRIKSQRICEHCKSVLETLYHIPQSKKRGR